MTLINFREYNENIAEKESQKSIDAISRYMQFQKFCGFCGKLRKEVKTLIAGPGVCICDECVKLSYDLIKDAEGNVTDPSI